MRKQHESVTHLSWTRTAYAKACHSTEDAMQYTVSRTAGGKWLLYSKDKLVKPYDYVPSDVLTLNVDHEGTGHQEESGSDGADKVSQPHHSSGPDTSQYTFAHVGVQASASVA